MSLYDQHSHERDIAINILLEEALRSYFNTAHEHQIIAITHPLLVGSENRYLMRGVLCEKNRMTLCRVYGPHQPHQRLFPVQRGDDSMQVECVVEIQHFLRDPKRAGCCYVDSRMYANLSWEIARVIFEPGRSVRISSSLDSILLMTLIRKFWIVEDYSTNKIQQILRLAADTLPFYLSNADYRPGLADYLPSQTLARRLPNYPNIQPLQDAIDLYLKVTSSLYIYIRHINYWLKREALGSCLDQAQI
jgi:hypothetical protein